MWRARFTTAILIAVWLLTPDLLCLIPGVEMTASEHECCERMGSDCGRIPMPDMHTCCRTVTPPHAIMVARVTVYPEQHAMMAPAIIPDLDLFDSKSQSVHWRHLQDPSPPPVFAQDSFDILRI